MVLIPARGQSNFDFENISIGQGISQSDITAILQDRTGFMWFATNNGLNRYDGYGFRTFKADSRDPSTLSSSILFSIADHQGHYLWVASKDGIDRYNAYTDAFEHYLTAADDHGNEVPLSRAGSLCLTADGELWGVMRGYVLRFDREQNRFRAYTMYNSTTNAKLIVLNCITEGFGGRMILATNRGVYAVDGPTMKGRLIFDPFADCGGRSSRVLTLFADSTDGSIYVGGDDGVFVLDREGCFIREIRHNGSSIPRASAFIRDSFGRLWAGTQEKGIYIEENGRVSNCTHDPRDEKTIGSNYVLSLYEDRSGAVWVGTSSGGVSKMSLHRRPFQTIRHIPNAPNSLPDNIVYAVYADSDSVVWAATKDGMLNKIVPSSGVVGQYDMPVGGIPGDRVKIYGIERRGDDGLWLATTHGLCAFDRQTGRFDRSPVGGLGEGVRMRSLMYDDDGVLWALSRNTGLYVIDGGRLAQHYNTANIGLTDNYVRGICQDHRGDVWVGTRGGGINVFRRDEEGYANTVVRHVPGDTLSLSIDNISVIYEDSHNVLWIGTWGGGLNRVVDRDRMRVKVYTEQDGLCDNVIFGIMEDGSGRLWISTYNGLSCFDPQSEQFRNYTAADGLPSNEFIIGSSWRMPDGGMVFGTIGGLTLFRPEEVVRTYPAPDKPTVVRLTVGHREARPGRAHGKRIILDRPVFLADGVTLAHNDHSFRLELSSFTFGTPGQTKFAYRLDGLDAEWNHTATGNAVSYANLRPGKYVFSCMAASSDGIWSEPYALSITLEPPFYASAAAYAIYLLLGISGVSAIVYYAGRAQQKKNQRLHEKIQYENKQALDQAKMTFFTNISHELRTPLALVAGLVERIGESLGTENPVSGQLTVMKRNTDRLLGLVNDLLDLRRIETGDRKLNLQARDVIAFSKAVWSYFESEAEGRGISFFFDSGFERYEATVDFGKTEKILYNLLSNALKFTDTFVEMSVRSDFRDGREHVLILVRDDGPGIGEQEQEKIFYRFYQSERVSAQHTGSGLGLNIALEMARLQGGDLTVSSAPGEGSSFCLRLPAHIAQPADENPAPEAETADPPPTVDGKPLILVVDDNADMRYYLREALQKEYRIAEAADGRSAIEQAYGLCPDLILCDVMMPDMDGVEVCGRLKERPQTRKIPVILATAKAAEQTRIDGLHKGADAYIVKPFTEAHLKAQIANILQSRDSIRTAISREIIATPQRIEVLSARDKLLAKAASLLEKHITDPDYDVDMLSNDLHISRVHLYRQLKETIGQSPSDFIRDFRLARAAGILEQNKLDVSEVTYLVGFSSPKYFTVCFKKKYGVTPQEYAVHHISEQNNKN